MQLAPSIPVCRGGDGVVVIMVYVSRAVQLRSRDARLLSAHCARRRTVRCSKLCVHGVVRVRRLPRRAYASDAWRVHARLGHLCVHVASDVPSAIHAKPHGVAGRLTG